MSECYSGLTWRGPEDLDELCLVGESSESGSDRLNLRWEEPDDIDLAVVDSLDDISQRQYNSWLEVARRWKIYEKAEQRVDRVGDVIQKYMELGAQPHHKFLDVGCLYPDILIDLRLMHGFGGRMVGVDPNPTFFYVAEHLLRREGGRPIEFGVGVAENLNDVWADQFEHGVPTHRVEIADNEFDFVAAFRMLYHALDPWQALLQLGQKVKPGGVLAVSTSGPDNKDVQRQQEVGGARYLSRHFRPTEPPPRFNERFDTVIAQQMLPELPGFVIVDEIAQDETVVHVTSRKTGDGTYDAHEDSFDSMISAYTPPPTAEQFRQMKQGYFYPAVRKAIKKGGGHMDVKIQQHWWFLRKIG